VLLGLIEAIGAGYLGELTGGVLGSQYSDIFAFIALIMVLTLRPSACGRESRRSCLSEPEDHHAKEQTHRLRRGRHRAAAGALVRAAVRHGPVRIIDLALLYVMLALGLNIVVGYAGLLDLGYVAFYALGSYMFALMASPHLSENFEAIAAAFPEACMRRCGSSFPWVPASPPSRRAAGCADPEAARRLSGHRDPGLRRDHPRVLNNLEYPANITNGPRGIGQIDSFISGG